MARNRTKIKKITRKKTGAIEQELNNEKNNDKDDEKRDNTICR